MRIQSKSSSSNFRKETAKTLNKKVKPISKLSRVFISRDAIKNLYYYISMTFSLFYTSREFTGGSLEDGYRETIFI